MIISYFALLIRVVLLAFERVVVRLLGDEEGDIYKNIASSFLFFFIGGVCLLPFSITSKVGDWSFLLPCYISSLVYSIGSVAYVTSLATGEVSLVTPINSLNSLFLLLLSVVFLGESFSLAKVAGIIIMIGGVFILKNVSSLLKNASAILNNLPCRLMFLYIFFQSVGRVLDKAFYVQVSPILYSTILYFFVGLNLFVFLVFKKKQKVIYEIFSNKKGLSILSGAINGYSYLALLIALNNLELSIAEPFSQVSMIITLILAHFIFKENIKEKIPGSILILIGGWLLLL
ncbi:GRP family sugar transporter [Clostridioides sp. ZZV15-6598]|uniref:GRP family sugar transporter n=1 Tax=Clostridioides sp. ZZV15-6598 TaxID=2811501 RepID=UPI001D119E6E|nr:EamA family transporter [Clostridioides sp. ZZV15-6598]